MSTVESGGVWETSKPREVSARKSTDKGETTGMGSQVWFKFGGGPEPDN